MTRRSSPSFAIGGVSWLDHRGKPGDATILPPCGGWRCFHCDEHFTHWQAAWRHFGAPGQPRGTAKPPRCQEAQS
jgi:hypothetical protein